LIKIYDVYLTLNNSHACCLKHRFVVLMIIEARHMHGFEKLYDIQSLYTCTNMKYACKMLKPVNCMHAAIPFVCRCYKVAAIYIVITSSSSVRLSFRPSQNLSWQLQELMASFHPHFTEMISAKFFRCKSSAFSNFMTLTDVMLCPWIKKAFWPFHDFCVACYTEADTC
jgi:hypothetical protein